MCVFSSLLVLAPIFTPRWCTSFESIRQRIRERDRYTGGQADRAIECEQRDQDDRDKGTRENGAKGEVQLGKEMQNTGTTETGSTNPLFLRRLSPPPLLPAIVSQPCVHTAAAMHSVIGILDHHRHHEQTTTTMATTDLAAQLAAGLGLNVVAPSSPRPSTGTEEEAATAMHETDGRYQDDNEEEEEMMMMDGDSAGARLGGWFNDGQNTSRRERTRAIRKEEKEGKSAEKVHA